MTYAEALLAWVETQTDDPICDYDCERPVAYLQDGYSLYEEHRDYVAECQAGCHDGCR